MHENAHTQSAKGTVSLMQPKRMFPARRPPGDSQSRPPRRRPVARHRGHRYASCDQEGADVVADAAAVGQRSRTQSARVYYEAYDAFPVPQNEPRVFRGQRKCTATAGMMGWV
ncbi:hypothetical protein PYCCODRAFT_1440443 [Trametes coccinea BRFM310]|uniref:Uncharacterized protein n=1 Tax=Trametes coccinea (strain BRFM310) TaxID=1353009 RepID=A0A1Y2I7N8_TRAC3|nr:hypothetical protein PYCCODRAFT_1440443 [Trametes coccinea BRFM310]